jgi:hypothetical protein
VSIAVSRPVLRGTAALQVNTGLQSFDRDVERSVVAAHAVGTQLWTQLRHSSVLPFHVLPAARVQGQKDENQGKINRRIGSFSRTLVLLRVCGKQYR